MQGILQSLVIMVPPSYLFVCYRFFNSGQPNRPKIKKQSKLTKPKVILLRLRNAKMQEILQSLVILVPPSYLFVCYRFFNSGQPNRPKIKRQSKLTKPKVILLRLRNAKMQGILQSLVMLVPPSYLFVCYRFFNSEKPNGPKIKTQSKLTKPEVILLRLRNAKMQAIHSPQLYGYPLLIRLIVIVSLIQGGQIDRRFKDKLSKPKVILLRKGLEMPKCMGYSNSQ